MKASGVNRVALAFDEGGGLKIKAVRPNLAPVPFYTMSTQLTGYPVANTSLSYRPDIDGLRAIAVLSVVLFHVDPAWIPGGFLGVDIFFVISGFLITRIIVSESDQQRFSVANFYNRRIKRIFPAMFVVVLVTLLVGQFALLPEDLDDLALSSAATVLSLANVFFTYFSDSSYFAPDSALRPLLHMWSLGVEEQFYVFWPVCAVLLFRRFSGVRLTLLLTVLALASFMLAEYLSPRAPLFSYYMLPTRAGELLLGALGFTLVRADLLQKLAGWAWEAVSVVAAAVLTVSFVFINEDMPFPGMIAIAPTAAVMALIVAGAARQTLVGRLLSLRPLVWIGLISYSMYLWHWPVLAFAKYAHGSLSLDYKLATLVVILLLSLASYWLVERPFRRNDLPLGASVLRYFVVPAVLVGVLCAGIVGTQGYGLHRVGDYTTRLAAIEGRAPASVEPRVCQRPQLTVSDVRDPVCATSAEPAVLLWGDSNAAHFVGALNRVAEDAEFDLRNAAHSSCPPLLDRPERFVTASRRDACARSAEVIHAELAQYPGLILAANWPAYFGRDEAFFGAFEDTIAGLTERGHDVTVIARIPRFDNVDAECESKQIKLPFISCATRDTATREETDRDNAGIRAIAEAAGARYVDFADFFCDDVVCSPFLAGTNAYYDPVHLSGLGSDLLGAAIVLDAPSVTPFRALSDLQAQGRPQEESRFDALNPVRIDDLSAAALWRTYGAELTESDSGWRAEDINADRFDRLEYEPENGRGVLLPAGQMLVLDMIFSVDPGVRPLLRLRASPAGGEETPEIWSDLNFLIFPDSRYVDIRPQGAVTGYEFDTLEGGRFRLRASLPATGEERYVRPIVYPAAAADSRSLEPAMAGGVNVAHVSVSLVEATRE